MVVRAILALGTDSRYSDLLGPHRQQKIVANRVIIRSTQDVGTRRILLVVSGLGYCP